MKNAHPEFPVVKDYAELQEQILKITGLMDPSTPKRRRGERERAHSYCSE